MRETPRSETVMRNCSNCSKRFRARRGSPITKCPKCARQDLVASVDQQRRREGPIYEKTVKAQLRFWLGEAERLGLEIE